MTLEILVADFETARAVKPSETLALGQKQERFARMLPLLLLKAFELGFEVRMGEGANLQGKGHMAGSLHYIKLAQDIALFKGGKYLTGTEDYRALGLFWENIGGSWGGRFGDGNHFSLSHGGKK
jgi:hypothetical protein